MNYRIYQTSKERVLNRLTSHSVDDERLPNAPLLSNLAGRSVLAYGVDSRIACDEAARRGAVRAVGVLPGAFVSSVDSSQACGVPPSGECFDDVLCLGELSLGPHPFEVLDHLIDFTRDRLVVEVDEIGEDAKKRLRFNWWRRLLLRGLRDLPVVFVAPDTRRTNRQRFYLTAEAVRRFMAEQRQVFSSVDVTSSPCGRRSLVIGKKRRVDRLLVIAGPTSAGKSTLIDALLEGRVPGALEQLGVSESVSWEPLDVYGIARDKRQTLSSVIMHYDFLTRVKWGFEHSQMTDFVDCIRSADEVTFLTLWTEPKQLRKQFHQSEILDHVSRTGAEPTNKKTLQLQEEYKDPQKIIDYYRAWFDHTSTLCSRHFVVSQTPTWRVTSVDQWRQEYDSSEGTP